MSLLDEAPLFSGLSSEELHQLENRLVRKNYRRNTVLIEKGDESSLLYFIIAGQVKVYIADDKNKEMIVNIQGPGEHFGELSLLNDIARTASVMTMEDSSFLVMSKQTFKDFLAEHPEAAFNLIRTLVDRVSALTDEIGSLALTDVYGRVRALLLKESAESKAGERTTGRISQQDIASRIGASREMVSRVFKDLKAGGYISLEGKTITIRKKLPAQW